MEKELCEWVKCKMKCPKCGKLDKVFAIMNISMTIRLNQSVDGEILFDKNVYEQDMSAYCDNCLHLIPETELGNIGTAMYFATMVGQDQNFISYDK